MKKKMKKNILAKRNTTPRILSILGSVTKRPINGMLYPPKYRVEIIADEINMFTYSANK
jgi:hypothetical protein